jgi:hypothetical protein
MKHMNPEKLRSVKVPAKTTRSFYPKNVAKDAHAFWIQLGLLQNYCL